MFARFGSVRLQGKVQGVIYIDDIIFRTNRKINKETIN